jgi:hypothetical protein
LELLQDNRGSSADNIKRRTRDLLFAKESGEALACDIAGFAVLLRDFYKREMSGGESVSET